MSTLYFDQNDRLDTIITRIRESPDSDLTLFIPKESVFYQNEVNKKVLQKVAVESGKTLKFGDEETQTQNEVGPGKETLTEAKRPESQSAKSVSQKTKGSKRLSGFKLFVILVGLFGTFAVAAAAFILLYLPKTTVILFVEERILQKEETIEVSPDVSEIEFAEKKIPGKVISATEEEKKSFSATGKKTVGEKATGTVVFLNWTNQERIFGVGTKLTVALGKKGEGLTFFLTEGVSVPVAPPSNNPFIREPGTVPVSIAAEDIGEKYNLEANTNFLIGNFQDNYEFSAINETAFSGGLTREVIVVSQEDKDKASEELKSKLLAQAREDLQSKVLGDQKLLDEVIAGDVLGVNFSNEIGDEVGSFETSLKTQSTALVYSESKLKELAEKILKDSVPEGYEISTEDLGVSIDLIERQPGGGLKLTGAFKTLVIPAFDEKELIEKLPGKRAQVASSILDELPNIKGYQISFWPKIPVFLQILPLRRERLIIEVETQK